MPYKNIVYAKLEKRMLDDHRWFLMSEEAQLTYIKFILASCATYNKTPKDLNAIRKIFKTEMSDKDLTNCITEIKSNFPKFQEDDKYYYFDDFDEKTNYISQGVPEEIPRKSKGLPKVGVEYSIIDKNRVYTEDKFIPSLKTLYPHIDITTEMRKIDGWLLAHPNRKKTRRFVINWLNRVEVPMTINQTPKGKPNANPL
jgi:hypothetical protein